MRIVVLLLVAMVLGLSLSCGDDGISASDSDAEAPEDPVSEEDDIAGDVLAEPDAALDVPADIAAEDPPEDLPFGSMLGAARITYYWVAFEGDYMCTSPDTVLATCGGEVIATVCNEFAVAARLEGTARLVDGRMINIGGCSCAGGFACFILLDTTAFPWGMGNRSNPLVPFVSIATDTDVIPSGTVLYSPDIDGVALPTEMGGGTHDGCLRADDVGGGITGMHVDFFAALRAYYTELDPQIPENIDLYTDSPRCDI